MLKRGLSAKKLTSRADLTEVSEKRKSMVPGQEFQYKVDKGDHIGIGSHPQILKLISTFNKEESSEKVKFSDYMVKINKRDKPQERVLLVTTKAVYNIMPNDYSRCKRRIPLALIDSLTISNTSDEFVVHVPGEYDYRMMSLKKEEVTKAMRDLYEDLIGDELPVTMTNEIVLKKLTNVKAKSRGFMGGMTRALRSFSITSKSSNSSITKEMVDEVKAGDQMVTDWAHGEASKVTPDDFNLIKVIGRGSFGKVMLVTLKGEEDKVYAMKILQKQAIIERNQVEHTLAEREVRGFLVRGIMCPFSSS